MSSAQVLDGLGPGRAKGIGTRHHAESLLLVLQPLKGPPAKHVLLFARGKFVHVGENDDDRNSLYRRGLDICEPANEVVAVQILRVAHDKVQGLGAGETGVDGMVVRVAAEVPEVNCDPLGSKTEDI